MKLDLAVFESPSLNRTSQSFCEAIVGLEEKRNGKMSPACADKPFREKDQKLQTRALASKIVLFHFLYSARFESHYHRKKSVVISLVLLTYSSHLACRFGDVTYQSFL